jgi:predicted AAA+ superfamily ATPase
MLLTRLARGTLRALSRQFPAVLLLGPRQCGKTTLVKASVRGSYFDLEKPSDQHVFLGDPELALRRMTGVVVLDEAHTLPELFPVLRALIDEQRGRPGRYVLLGSVNPILSRQIAESLAGRVGVLELTPLLWPETHAAGLDITQFWLRGGYPDACLAGSATRRAWWYDSYLQTFLERDIARYGLKASAIELRRFVTMLAHVHGGLLNASDLGRSLGWTYHTLQRYLDLLEGHYLVRRLQPYAANVGKRLVKSPKVYLRDAGVLHHLLGVHDEHALLASPKRGASWEGMLIEQVIALERLRHPGSMFSFYRTQAGAEIDLLIERGATRIGLEFKAAASATPADARSLRIGMADGVITRGLVVCAGTRRYPLDKQIAVVGADELLTSAAARGDW